MCIRDRRDWILTRILWLGGLEPGKNRYGKVDTTWRYIYIHGSPDELMTGCPDSHVCIRIKNADILYLFNHVEAGLKVYIHEQNTDCIRRRIRWKCFFRLAVAN